MWTHSSSGGGCRRLRAAIIYLLINFFVWWWWWVARVSALPDCFKNWSFERGREYGWWYGIKAVHFGKQLKPKRWTSSCLQAYTTPTLFLFFFYKFNKKQRCGKVVAVINEGLQGCFGLINALLETCESSFSRF